MSDDTEIDTSGTVHAETSNVDITEHVSRDGDGELCFELTNRDEAVSIQTRFDDGETRVAALAMLLVGGVLIVGGIYYSVKFGQDNEVTIK